MYGTHCKHCSLIPLLVFNNNLTLLRCGYMCPGTLVHISRHRGKTSIIIIKDASFESVVCLAIFACIGFYFGFPVLWLLYYTYLYPAFPFVFYSTSLLLWSYYTMHVPYLISFTISLPAPVCLCPRHDFNACLWFRFIDTRVLVPARHLAFITSLIGKFLTLLDLHIQILELEACEFSQLLIRDAQWIIGRPSRVLSFQASC